jgi:hypothetical protein
MGRKLRMAAAGSIVLAPLSFGIVDQLRMRSDTPAEVGPVVGASGGDRLAQEIARLAEIQANPGPFTAAVWLEYVTIFVFIVALVAIWRLAVDRAPRWAWASAVTGTVAAYGLVAHLATNLLPSLVAAGQEEVSGAAELMLAMGDHGFMWALVVPFLLGALLTPIVQGIALRRARIVPLWAVLAIVAGSVLIAMTGSQVWSSALYSLLLTAAFAPAALAMLRFDGGTAPTPEVTDRTPASTTEPPRRRGRRRILVGMLTCALGVALAVPAAASPPERERFVDDDRLSYDCGGVVITEDGGHYVVDSTVKEHADGRVRVVYVATARQVTASDEEGNRYRIVGSVSGTAALDPLGEPLQEHIGFRLTIRHATGGGVVGHVWFRVQLRRDGTVAFVDRSDCQPG